MDFILKNVIIALSCLFLTKHTHGNSDSNNSLPHYTISTFVHPPWILKPKTSDNNTKLEGYIVDLVKLLADDIGFEYDLVLSPEDKVGHLKPSDGSWDGVIGQIVDDKADFAAAAIEIKDQRRQIVDLTSPFVTSARTILIKKPVPHHKSVLLVLEPFDFKIWILLVIVNFAVGGLLYLVNKFSPSEWSRVPSDQDPTNSRNSFNAQNSFFFVHTTLTLQGFKEVPRSAAGRIVAACWLSFCLLIIVSYIASFAALVIANNTNPHKPVIPFKTFQQMLLQTKVRYGLVGSHRILGEMQNSDDDMIRKIYKSMDLGLYTSSIKTGFEKIRNSDGDIAEIVDTLEADYYLKNHQCEDTISVGEGFLREDYGFACKKGSSLCNSLSQSFLSLREDGNLHLLHTKWFRNDHCPSTSSNNYISAQEITLLSHEPLTVAETALAWIILLVGFILGPVLLLIEVFIAKRRNKKSFTPQSQRPAPRETGEEDGEEIAGDLEAKAPIAAWEH